MLAAGQRLRRSSDFAAAIRGGRRAGRGVVVVHLTLPPTENLPPAELAPARTEEQSHPARAGFVVSRAVGGAVARNTVRRRLRHLVRELLPQLPPGTTLVVRALPGAAAASYNQLRLDLASALSAARAGRRNRRGERRAP